MTSSSNFVAYIIVSIILCIHLLIHATGYGFKLLNINSFVFLAALRLVILSSNT
jgi:hypothetical protein